MSEGRKRDLEDLGGEGGLDKPVEGKGNSGRSGRGRRLMGLNSRISEEKRGRVKEKSKKGEGGRKEGEGGGERRGIGHRRLSG